MFFKFGGGDGKIIASQKVAKGLQNVIFFRFLSDFGVVFDNWHQSISPIFSPTFSSNGVVIPTNAVARASASVGKRCA